MRTVTPTAMASAFVALAVISVVGLGSAYLTGHDHGAYVVGAASLGYLWFASAQIEPGRISGRWLGTVGASALVLVGLAIWAAGRRLAHHEYVDWIWPLCWGLGFSGTAVELLTGRRFDEEP